MAQVGGRRRERTLWALAVMGAAVFAVGAVAIFAQAGGRERVHREDAALEVLRRVVRSEKAYHERTGRYGWLEDLRGEGLLDGFDVVAGPQGLEVRSDGYRLDVLLPGGRGSKGQVTLLAHGRGVPDPGLVALHVAAVARPIRPGLDGFRLWYLDEAERAFLSEGVCDAEGLHENPLPEERVDRSHGQDEPGLVWRALDELERD